MQLYASALSPFVRLVRVALIELGLDGSVEVVDTKVSPVEANRGYGEIMPLRQVPSLKLDDGTVLHDSTIILLWIDEHSGGRLLPAGDARWALLARYNLTHGLLEAAVNLRYERLLRPEELRWPAWIDDKMDKIERTLAVLEAELEPVAVRPDMAQIGLGCVLGYLDFRLADYPWRERFPKLAAWYAELAERPSFKATVPQL